MIVAGPLSLTLIRGCTFENLVLTMLDSNGVVVNITGFTVSAQVRATSGGTVIIDLSPSITDAVNGQITIPTINDETTLTYTAGNYFWDLLLEDGSDNNQKMLTGSFIIENKITNS